MMNLTTFFVNVGQNMKNCWKQKGYKEKSLIELNNKCEISKSMF